MTRLLCAILAFAIAGCASPPEACLAPLQPTIVTELFFGRNIPGRPPLTEGEWSSFAQVIIAREFPGGFTVLDADGQWLAPRTDVLAHERTKLLIVAAAPADDLLGRIARIRDAYESAYKQAAVGELTYRACGSFQD
jgi:hypothetical protein